MKAVQLNNKEVVVKIGSIIQPEIQIPILGDTSDEIIISNEDATVFVKINQT